MNLQDIKARHAHVENQERTQSVELITERRSKSHKDREWLIQELERALEQNERLEAELGALSEAVAALETKPVKTKEVKKRGKGKKAEG